MSLTLEGIQSGSQVALFEPEHEGQRSFEPEQTVLNVHLLSVDGNPTDLYFVPPEGCLVLFVRIRHLEYRTFETLTAPHSVVEVEQELDLMYPDLGPSRFHR